MGRRRIGDLLVDAGVIARAQLERVLAKSPQLGERRILSELYTGGHASERQLAEVLARHLGVPVVVLTESVIDTAIVRLVPPDVMRRHLVLPVHADERSVTVVMPDPEAPGVLVPLGFATGRRVVPLIGIHSILEEVIERALAALQRGDAVWAGAHALTGGTTPALAVARDVPRVALDEANALAKQIVEALSDRPGLPKSTPIGAVHLKQMLLTRTAASPDDLARALAPPPERERAPLVVNVEPRAVKRAVALVVDDDTGVRGLLSKALSHDGITVVEAKNGDEAVTMLRVMRPDVVLLDAMLPAVHGFEICSSLKRSQLKDIPVIMISAVYRGWELARDIQEHHGADHFVEKPFEVTYVRRLVADVLRRPTATAPAAAATAAAIDEVRRQYEEHAAEGLFLSADADVERWIDLDPFDGRAWLERGNLCAHAGDQVGAMAAYEAAVVYDPALLVAHLGLAMIYEHLGFVRRARTTWQRARELSPDEALRASIDEHLR